MPELRGSEIIAEYLIKEKVSYILGYASHGAIGLLDGIYGRTDKIKVISAYRCRRLVSWRMSIFVSPVSPFRSIRLAVPAP